MKNPKKTKKTLTQKDRVVQFLESLELGKTKKESYEIFAQTIPDISKGNYDFYRNQAEKEGVYEFAEEIKIVAPINLGKVAADKILNVTKIDLDHIDPIMFQPLKTNTAFDLIASKRNGIMRGTVNMITGESGAGKTTVSTNLAEYIKENNPGTTAGFISAEMDELDWTEECLDNKRLADLDTVFLLNYIDAPNYYNILKEALMKWDYVVLDSFEVIIDQLKDIYGWTSKKAESELISLLRQVAADKQNTIMVVQQYTKGGTFVGSNKIKHLLTAMIFVMFDKDGNRYVVFHKNRRGGHMVHKKLYFTKNKETGRLEFDGVRFDNEQAIVAHRTTELDRLIEEDGLFDEVLMDLAAKKAKERIDVIKNNTEMVAA